ncbi:hypothetical protein PspLS_11591 [Pyricularia sp. CBS 133598]|nr:hypothetical protein PspLS_11591 [Pyricularia sp. CBS 133598]
MHHRWAPRIIFGLTAAAALATAADLPTKRGLAYIQDKDTNPDDSRIMLSDESLISWYYTWSRNMARAVGDSVRFVPLIHNLDDSNDRQLVSTLDRAPDSSTHLLSFNEPDGETDTGGSAISPREAAESYIRHIAPLRTETRDRKRTWKISHPSVTGSPRGLDWLRDFNESCWDIDKDNGCPTDFVAVHWYGDQYGLRNWLGDVRDLYGNGKDMAGKGVDGKDLKYWITEMAMPNADDKTTFAMMNESLEYLDEQDWVEAYAWFGAFRNNNANEWTGNKVSLFDSSGGLTDLGALYLGGEERGFTKGMGGGAAGLAVPGLLVLVMALFGTGVVMM